MKKNSIVILDFGSQYNQLIARRIREMGVYAEVVPYFEPLDKIIAREPRGIIMSGGPASTYLEGSPTVDKAIYDAGIPILGICYGMQLTSRLLGGKVERADMQEFGKAELIIDDAESKLFVDVPNNNIVWMSHGDHVSILPEGFEEIAHTTSCIAAIANVEKNIYGIQYHAEVTHSVYGKQMFENFVFKICKCEKNWSMGNYIEQTVADIREKVGKEKVMLGLSGGVDSSVAAMLIHKAIGDQLVCIFVDTGLLRKNEAKNVMEIYGEHYHMNIKCVNAEERFLKALEGVSEPEAKRKIIGKEFIEVFNDEASKLTDVKFLAQGTIYPDVIESQSVKGPSQTIKSHHNVGGLPEDMKFELVEPLKMLFKDEVRECGVALGLPYDMVYRQPFPGPGLGVRCLGAITRDRLEAVRESDAILREEFEIAGLNKKVWQYFTAIPDFKSVGVKNHERSYEWSVIVRAVNTVDAMSAEIEEIPYSVLKKITDRITHEVKGVNRVVYDLTPKPSGTIEWE